MSHTYNPWSVGQLHNVKYTSFHESDSATIVRSPVTTVWRVLVYLYAKQRQGIRYHGFNPSELMLMPHPDTRPLDPSMLYSTLQFMDALNLLTRDGVNYYAAWLDSPLLNAMFQQHMASISAAMQGEFPPLCPPSVRPVFPSAQLRPMGMPAPTPLKPSKQSKFKQRNQAWHARYGNCRGYCPKGGHPEIPVFAESVWEPLSSAPSSPPRLVRQTSLYLDTGATVMNETDDGELSTPHWVADLMDEATSRLCFKHNPPRMTSVEGHCDVCEKEGVEVEQQQDAVSKKDEVAE